TSPSQPAAKPASPARRTVVGLGIAAAFLFAIFCGLWLSQLLKANRAPQTPSPTFATKEPAPTPAAPLAPTATLAPVAPKPFDPVQALERVFEARDRDHRVSVVPDQPRIQVGKDLLRFRVSSGKPGYVYVLMVGTDRTQFNLLFPNAVDAGNRIAAGQELDLPRKGWAMTAGGPAGADHFVAIVSENPRDFSAAGLRKVDPFGEFPPEVSAKLAAQAGSAPL